MPNYTNYPNPYPTNYYTRPQLNQYAFVNGIEGAKSYQVLPNQTMLLMDNDNPVCYMKTANSIGQSNLRYFRLEEIDEVKTKEILSKPQEIVEYALKSDIDKLNDKLDDLTKLIKKVNKEMNKEVVKGE